MKRTTEQGKPVVYFQVKASGLQRIRLVRVEKIIGDETVLPWDFGPNGKMLWRANFWSPAQQPPFNQRSEHRKEFGVLVPTNAAPWKLRVILAVYGPGFTERAKRIWREWAQLRSEGRSFYDSAKIAWGCSYGDGYRVLESETLTNGIARAEQ